MFFISFPVDNTYLFVQTPQRHLAGVRTPSLFYDFFFFFFYLCRESDYHGFSDSDEDADDRGGYPQNYQGDAQIGGDSGNEILGKL